MSQKKSPSEKLVEKLTTGITTFTYRKKDGNIRYAVGTAHSDVIPEDHKPKDPTASIETKDGIRYYDYLSLGWRSLKKDNIVRILAAVRK